MRVVIISKALVVGAYQRKAELIAKAHDVDLTCVVPPHWGGQYLEREYTEGYRLVVQPVRFGESFHLFHFPRLGRLLRQIRPDVVHVDEEPYNLATFLATGQALAVGAKPIFFTWQNLLRFYPAPFSWMERWVYRSSRQAIAGNAEAVQVLRSKGYRGAVTVIPQFGVDEELFAPASGTSGSRPFTVGFAGRLIQAKGVEVLLAAVSKLSGEWRLRIVGEGPLRESLSSLSRKLGVDDRVDIVGSVPSVRMPEYFRSLDVLVVPSLTTPSWKEQYGRVLQEAMACGVPVIGSDSGEIPNVIGDAGIVVPEGDPGSLTGALERLADATEHRADFARRGRARVLTHFTHQRIADQTLAVYRAVSDGSRDQLLANG